jgi:glycosyltransferase involved in cell wall biosynthesis/SAM-dependent methyltransferase
VSGGSQWTLGVLPSLGSGLSDLARSGQHERLLQYDLRAYAEVYDRILYFSYFDERLEQFTDDPLLRERVRVLPRRGRWAARTYAALLPFLYRREFESCRALRVMQFPGVVPALIARRVLGIPFVVTYGYHYGEIARLAGSRVKPVLYRTLERVALPQAAGVVVTSPEMEAEVRRWRTGGIGQFPNGVDVQAFSPAPRVSTDPAVILYVGRLEAEKNIGRLIDAVAALRPRRLRLVLIGDGRLRHSLERRASEAGVSVEFRGVIPHSALPQEFNAVAVFALPSLSEGHPKALIEAMACGTPCAASARGGIPSLIEDGKTGLLFEPTDVTSIAAALARLLDDQPYARALGAAARTQVVERYDARRLLREEARWVRSVTSSPTETGAFEAYAEAFPIDEVLPEYVERRLVEQARSTPRTVLDLGAGDGRYVDLFSRHLPPATLVIGVEISFLRARRMRARGLRVVVARSEELPFREGTFELVTLIEVIEHTTSPKDSLDEIHRVMARNGRLVLTTPNYPVKRLYDVRAAVRARSLGRLRDDPTHFSKQSASRLGRLLHARFPRVTLEGTAILGEGRFAFVRRLKERPIGLRLANKLFAICSKLG